MIEKSKKLKLAEPVVGKEELLAIQRVFESGWLAEGEVTRAFETKVADFVGAKHAIATTNCTTALELALRAINVTHGDEVIIPDFTYPATADTVRWLGAKPILVDVDFSYNIDVEEVEKAISKRTKCIMPVSWGGNPLNMAPLIELKEKHDLYIIEDAACSLGSKFLEKKTGVLADLTCFSFHARKVITTGEGGMVTTNNEELAEEIRCLKRFGIMKGENGDEFVKVGTNCKFSDILGAIGIEQMKKIDRIVDRHIELANNYDKLLNKIELVKPPTRDDRAKHVYQTYAIYLEKEGIRDKIIEDLKRENIETQIGTYAIHMQKAFENEKKIGKLPIAEKLYKNLLSLPMCYSMTSQDQEHIITKLSQIMKSYL